MTSWICIRNSSMRIFYVTVTDSDEQLRIKASWGSQTFVSVVKCKTTGEKVFIRHCIYYEFREGKKYCKNPCNVIFCSGAEYCIGKHVNIFSRRFKSTSFNNASSTNNNERLIKCLNLLKQATPEVILGKIQQGLEIVFVTIIQNMKITK